MAAILILFITACGDTGSVTDIDGNVYKTIKIGNQVWMAGNLKVTKYRNGNPILHLKDNESWITAEDGAYCSYNNSSSDAEQTGLLYNWYAINDSRNIAPEGWHVPNPQEIAVLVEYLKGDTVAAAKMKATGTQNWLLPNEGANNKSGFAALPGGYRYGKNGSFHTAGSNAYWWCTTRSFEVFSWSSRIYQTFADVDRDSSYMTYGLSLRCIKDQE